MYEKLAMIGPTISGKSVMCVVYNFFTSINLNSFFQMKIYENRQPLVIFFLSLNFYSITFFIKSDRNYVAWQFCYHFYHRLAELLPKTWWFCYLGRLATVTGSFATRFGRFVDSFLCVVYNVFTIINLNSFFSNEDMWK